MEEPTVAELLVRLRRLEDEAAIQRLILSYGPAADAGLNSLAAALWTEDGVYDWDPDGAPQEGRAAVGRMLHGEPHQSFIADGIAHFSGPALVKLDGDQATALTYSLVMRREEERFFLWRVSASRWDLERVAASWQVRRRTNRLLNASRAGSRLFEQAMHEMFEEPGIA